VISAFGQAYISDDQSQWSCVGYFRYGSQTPGGYSFYLIGLYCDPWQRKSLSDSQVVEAISSITVKD
jgi:hypothetical protein